MRIASSLTRDFSSFVAGVFRVVAFFRGELVLLAAGFAAFPFSAAPLDGAVSLSLAFNFFAMVKQLSLYPAELNSQAVFAKNWRELDPSVAFAMRHFIFRWLATTVAVMVAASVIHGIRYDSAGSLIGAALLLGILNAFVRPVLLILSAPLILLTLGLFILVVNGLLLWFVPNIVPGFHVDNFGSAFWGAIVIGLVSWMLSAFFRGSDGRVHVLTHHTQIKRVQGRVIEPGDRS
jgi:putative membrane protein